MKKVTRKALSLLLSFAMLLGMAQGICTAPAFAATTAVSIGGVTVDSGDWYAQTDSSGTVTACESTDGWNIHVVEDDSGDTPTATITLKNAVIDNSSSNDAISAAGYDLKIELEGTANQIGTGAEITNGTAIYSDTGNSVAITGEGNLALKGRYGIYVQGSGNVTIDVSGSLSIKSLWQMVSANGNLAAKAKSISMDGYYIYCSNGGACLTANDGDLTVNGTDDYGISATGNIELEAPSGAVSVTGGHYSNITTGGTLGISISARDDVTLTGTVKGPPVSVASETGNVTVNGYYAAIEGATKSVTVSAPMGDVTLKSDSNSNIISGSSSYPLAITAGGALDAEGPYGIEGYGSAVLKAKSVRVALTDNGYGFRGDSLTITNPEGGNCSEVSVSGGGGGRNAIDAFGDVTVKADQVMIAAAADAAHAVYDGGGSITIGDAGLIVGAVTGDPISIAKGVVQASQNGGDKSGGLDLETTPPTMTTYYTAGNGYALFTPATADPAAPAKLTLHNATIHNLNPSHGNIASDFGIALPDGTITIQAEGTNTVIANYTSDIAGSDTDVTLSGGGILNVDEIDLVSSAENLNSFTKDPGTTLNGIVESYSATEGSDPGVTTVYGNVTANRDDHVVWTLPGIATVDSGATLTIPANKVIEFSNSLTNNGTIVNNGTLQLYGDSITNNHSIVNNGEIWMPYNTTVEQIKALNLTGAGSVMINDEGGDSVEKVYADGAIYAYGDDVTGDFDLTAPPTEATYYKAGEGYALFTPADGGTPAKLTMHNADLGGVVTLPSTPVTLELAGTNHVFQIEASDDSTVSGSGSLDVFIFRNSDSAAELTINDGATLNAWYEKTGTNTVDIYGSYTVDNYYGLNVRPTNKVVLAPGAVLTLANEGYLQFLKGTPLSNMTIGRGASIVNNTYITLPLGTTAAQIAALPLSGTGVVRVATAYYDGPGVPSAWDAYTNDGTALKTIDGGLDLTDGDHHSGATLKDDGYTWTGNDTDGYTLTLSNVYIDGDITLPDNWPVVINTTANSVISGGISGAGSYHIDFAFAGTAPLTINGGINGFTNNDTITVRSGAQVTINGFISIGDSGTDGTLNVTGSGTKLNIFSYGYAVSCDTVNVTSGASLTVKAEGNSMGVKALTGVNVTGGSTLTAGCNYGVYIIGGKLTVDSTSKLITNASVASFCVVDTTNDKAQGDVLSLPSLPSGTGIASATGSTDGYGYTYWSLVSTGGTLSATDENSEPATLTGAATGTLTFAKSNSNNNDGRNGSGSSGSTDKTVPTSVTDPSSGASADLSGATFPSGITTLTLSVVRLTPAGYPVSPLTPCSFPDLDGIAAYQAAVANQGLNIIGDPVPYRVSLTDQNGNTVQPVSGIVKIKMPLPTGLRGTPRIFHYGSDGTLTDFGAEVQNGYLIYAAACLGSFIVGGTGDSITLDTTSYTMPENGSYQIGARVTGSKAAVVKVHSTNDNTATVTKLTNGNYQVNGKNPGMAYIMFDVYDNKNHLLTHASVRVDVKTGVRPHGDSTRQYGIF